MMNTTLTADQVALDACLAAKLAAYRAKNAAIAASTRYASYNLYRVEGGNRTLAGEVQFPNNPCNANFGGVCFYDPATDTFRDSTEVNGFFLERVA